jgi:methyl-accepting chemotaxis protein
MEPTLEEAIAKIEELSEQIRSLSVFQERQQDTITSLIALAQQQTAVIEQQVSTIQRFIGRSNNTPRTPI